VTIIITYTCTLYITCIRVETTAELRTATRAVGGGGKRIKEQEKRESRNKKQKRKENGKGGGIMCVSGCVESKKYVRVSTRK